MILNENNKIKIQDIIDIAAESGDRYAIIKCNNYEVRKSIIDILISEGLKVNGGIHSETSNYIFLQNNGRHYFTYENNGGYDDYYISENIIVEAEKPRDDVMMSMKDLLRKAKRNNRDYLVINCASEVVRNNIVENLSKLGYRNTTGAGNYIFEDYRFIFIRREKSFFIYNTESDYPIIESEKIWWLV